MNNRAGIMYDVGVRNTAVFMYRHHFRSVRRVARYVNVAKSTVHRWLSSHPATRHRRTLARKKITQTVLDVVREGIERNPFLTLADLRERIAHQASAILSSCSVRTTLRLLGCSRKRTYARAPNTDRVDTARREFTERLRAEAIDEHDVVSVDETCFYLHMRPRYGYAPRGRRIGVPLHHLRHHKMTLLLAISSQGIVHWQLLADSATSATFAAFISECAPLPHHRFVLMDNAAFHKTSATLSAVRAIGLEPLFTPPYTPEWNPVEHAFHVLKAAYRRRFRLAASSDARDPAVIMEHRLSACFEDDLGHYNPSRTFASCWSAALAGDVENVAFEKV